MRKRFLTAVLLFAPLFFTVLIRAADYSDPSVPVASLFRPVPEEWTDGHRLWQGISSIEATSESRVWIVWYSGGKTECEDNYLLLSTSGDGGVTWSEPFMAVGYPDGPIRQFDPALWCDPLGRLWLFWAQGEMNYDCKTDIWDGRHGVWAIRADNPADGESAAWSVPRRLCDGVMINKPIVDSHGRWLYPVALWQTGPSIYQLDPKLYGANVYESADQGETLHFIGGTDCAGLARFANEHNLIELRDGRLWLLSRINKGIGESFSSDGGKSWSEMTVTPYRQSAARTFTRRLKSGNILFIKNGPFDGPNVGRSQMTAFLSEDDGKTWIGGLVLDPRDQVSYPDAGESDDGTLFVTWDHDRYGEGEICFARFTEEDVKAGKFVSDKVILPKAVNRLRKEEK